MKTSFEACRQKVLPVLNDYSIAYRAVATIIFKTIGTDSPQAYGLRKIYPPAPPFQCCVPIFILFQAATVSAYSTTTLIGEGAGEGRNCERETGLSS